MAMLISLERTLISSLPPAYCCPTMDS
jgi:hypothetical protein